MTVDSMAKVILSYRDDISNKKLQKLAYYVYSWHLTIMKKEIANMSFEAWEHGPVCRKLYNEYKQFGRGIIPQYHGFVLANDDEIRFVGSVLSVYGSYSADELEYMTHNEMPWNEARRGCASNEASDAIITKESIVRYYSMQYELKKRIIDDFEKEYSLQSLR